jgi:glycogen operon protein
MSTDPRPSRSYPIGATVHPDGVNFSIFSRNSTALELLLFDEADAARPSRVIPFDPARDRTFYYWHKFVPGLRAGQLYGYRAYGPFQPHDGLRFDPGKVLLDPYARGIMVGDRYDREAAKHPGDNCRHAMKSVVVDPQAYDWGHDMPLGYPYSETIIYELHVGGFTRHPSSGVQQPGTYRGLIEKIPYLKDLGVTTIELLPVQQFDEQDVDPPLKNYWGYNPIGFFAPHRGYCSNPTDPLGPIDEFREMVKAFHRAGLEVILDVVFNHTAESDHTGPTLCFRGLENRAYYMLEADRAYYANYSGCGNTVNGNHSIVRRLIIDCLRYWVEDMHVDGFRFDLAAVLARDEWGQPLKSPQTLWTIESDPVLAGTKIIAEAWDAAGLYQVGSFIGHRWAEWNGQFRDDVRRFVKSDSGAVQQLAARLTGSPDLYPQPDREPNRSINFVTCHDGFTLNDLVSYNVKHNEANGHANADGPEANFSWNCGVEGPTSDPQIEALRLRQIKNLLTILFVSQGTPMLSMGDEVRRTQHGNNNPYNQDNEGSWFDWRNVEQNADLLRFVRELLLFTQIHPVFRQERFWAPAPGVSDRHIITWHGIRLAQPDWGSDSHSLAFLLDEGTAAPLYILLNAYWAPLEFDLPPLPPHKRWHRLLDTALPSPNDILPLEEAVPLSGHRYRAESRSAVVLIAEPV